MDSRMSWLLCITSLRTNLGLNPAEYSVQLKAKTAKIKARGTVGKAFMQMNETTKPGGLNVCYSYIFLEVIIVISLLKTARFKKKWLYSNKYLFFKLAVTEVEYELLKCLWGAGLFFFSSCRWKIKTTREHRAKEERQNVRQDLSLDQWSQSCWPRDKTPKVCQQCQSPEPPSTLGSGEWSALPKEASWQFTAVIDLCKAYFTLGK